jgi:hypothetical protein
MFMDGSEVEFGRFFQEKDGVYRHKEQSENPDNPERGRRRGGFRRKHERPKYQERAEERAYGNKDKVEAAERHGGLFVEKVIEDRAALRERKQSCKAAEKEYRPEEDPVDEFLLVIQVHEDRGDEGRLGRRDGEADDGIRLVETVAAKIEELDFGNKDSEDGADQQGTENREIGFLGFLDRFNRVGHFRM